MPCRQHLRAPAAIENHRKQVRICSFVLALPVRDGEFAVLGLGEGHNVGEPSEFRNLRRVL